MWDSVFCQDSVFAQHLEKFQPIWDSVFGQDSVFCQDSVFAQNLEKFQQIWDSVFGQHLEKIQPRASGLGFGAKPRLGGT